MQTIKKALYFTSLDGRFNPCSREAAVFQLEKYRTDAGSAFAISNFTGNFSYSINQQIDTVPRVELNTMLNLNNVIKNAYLNAVSSNRTL
jgi:hypothetical protein